VFGVERAVGTGFQVPRFRFTICDAALLQQFSQRLRILGLASREEVVAAAGPTWLNVKWALCFRFRFPVPFKHQAVRRLIVFWFR
jgi:hypothetical protein